jgi:hypothetical protein
MILADASPEEILKSIKDPRFDPEACAKFGGDRRCGARKAASAFLTVGKPNDDPESPYLNLVVYGKDDTVNAVEALRQKFDTWKTKMNS